MKNKADLKKYLLGMIRSSDDNPPTSDFQKGYLAALIDIMEDLCMTGEERMESRLLGRACTYVRLSRRDDVPGSVPPLG
jgi:hypothetical protein